MAAEAAGGQPVSCHFNQPDETRGHAQARLSVSAARKVGAARLRIGWRQTGRQAGQDQVGRQLLLLLLLLLFPLHSLQIGCPAALEWLRAGWPGEPAASFGCEPSERDLLLHRRPASACKNEGWSSA